MELDALSIVILMSAGVFAGFINTVAGGGSLLTLPIMIFMGLPSNVANATNRVAIFSQNMFSVAGFRSKGVSAFPYAFWLAGTAIIGAIIGAQFAMDIKGEVFNRILAIIMIAVLLLTIFKPGSKVGQSEKMEPKDQIIGAVTFFFIGIYGGFIQAGVGFIIMAALTNINALSLAKTNSIKVFVVLIYTISALGVFIYQDMINWAYGLTLAVGNSTGGWIASRWSADKDDRWIRIILIITVSVMAIKLWFF
ncbi:MAG: sulfite exporter TauE/SafE family protein [Cyclobacteriaceae bacterium]